MKFVSLLNVGLLFTAGFSSCWAHEVDTTENNDEPDFENMPLSLYDNLRNKIAKISVNEHTLREEIYSLGVRSNLTLDIGGVITADSGVSLTGSREGVDEEIADGNYNRAFRSADTSGLPQIADQANISIAKTASPAPRIMIPTHSGGGEDGIEGRRDGESIHTTTVQYSRFLAADFPVRSFDL